MDCCNWIFGELQRTMQLDVNPEDVGLVKEQISLVLRYYAVGTDGSTESRRIIWSRTTS